MISSDEVGLVVAVAVADNQPVHRGDLLFKLDDQRPRQALDAADALVAQRQAEYRMRRHQLERRSGLDTSVLAAEQLANVRDEAAMAKARLDDARAQQRLAQINLARTEVRAPVDGWVTNLTLHVGEFVQPGQAKLALINQNSLWVYGYFEENRLPGVRVGQPAEVTLLGTNITLHGHVDSIAHGITDRDNATGSSLLADVNPSFSWVRLAQRVPVRIHLDALPATVTLAAGMSCTVRLR